MRWRSGIALKAFWEDQTPSNLRWNARSVAAGFWDGALLSPKGVGFSEPRSWFSKHPKKEVLWPLIMYENVGKPKNQRHVFQKIPQNILFRIRFRMIANAFILGFAMVYDLKSSTWHSQGPGFGRPIDFHPAAAAGATSTTLAGCSILESGKTTRFPMGNGENHPFFHGESPISYHFCHRKTRKSSVLSSSLWSISMGHGFHSHVFTWCLHKPRVPIRETWVTTGELSPGCWAAGRWDRRRVDATLKKWEKSRVVLTGWWFGCHFIFSHILGISSSQLTFIFFRGVQTTNQLRIFDSDEKGIAVENHQ